MTQATTPAARPVRSPTRPAAQPRTRQALESSSPHLRLRTPATRRFFSSMSGQGSGKWLANSTQLATSGTSADPRETRQLSIPNHLAIPAHFGRAPIDVVLCIVLDRLVAAIPALGMRGDLDLVATVAQRRRNAGVE